MIVHKLYVTLVKITFHDQFMQKIEKLCTVLLLLLFNIFPSGHSVMYWYMVSRSAPT